MIRLITFSILVLIIFWVVWAGIAGIFGSVILLAASVTAFCLLVGLSTELLRE